MPLTIEANSYSGCFGTLNNKGNIIHIKLNCKGDKIPSDNKEIILLIDVSASMSESMKSVKSSLLAFRDSIVEKTPEEMEKLNPDEKDKLLRNKFNIRLITFSNDVKEVWSNESNKRFEDIVIKLRAETMTNMGDALKMSFEKIKKDIYTWIIIMTDGESNEGPCRTHNSFEILVNSKKPVNTKIVALGYGNNFDAEVLNKIGTFVYVEHSEMIPVVLGNLVDEIMNSIGFNCTINIPEVPFTEINDDTIIVAKEDNNIGKIIVGDGIVGPICNKKSYDYVYLLGSNLSDKIDINIKYTNISTRENIIITKSINQTENEPTTNIKNLFFEAERKRLVYRLYRALQKGNKLIKEILLIKETVNKWTEPEAELHKDILLKLIEDTEMNIQNNHNILNHAVSSGYTLYDDNNPTLTSTNYYLVSPLINQ